MIVFYQVSLVELFCFLENIQLHKINYRMQDSLFYMLFDAIQTNIEFLMKLMII